MSEENVARADPSRVLMTDTLRDVLPEEFATEEASALVKNTILVVLGRVQGGNESALVGTLEEFMFQEGVVEVAAKVMLDEALSVVKSRTHSFSFIELHNNEDVTRFEAEYTLQGVRMGSIDYRRRMCVLMLNLAHRA